MDTKLLNIGNWNGCWKYWKCYKYGVKLVWIGKWVRMVIIIITDGTGYGRSNSTEPILESVPMPKNIAYLWVPLYQSEKCAKSATPRWYFCYGISIIIRMQRGDCSGPPLGRENDLRRVRNWERRGRKEENGNFLCPNRLRLFFR